MLFFSSKAALVRLPQRSLDRLDGEGHGIIIMGPISLCCLGTPLLVDGGARFLGSTRRTDALDPEVSI
jgi:hypothetical protein